MVDCTRRSYSEGTARATARSEQSSRRQRMIDLYSADVADNTITEWTAVKAVGSYLATSILFDFDALFLAHSFHYIIPSQCDLESVIGQSFSLLDTGSPPKDLTCL